MKMTEQERQAHLAEGRRILSENARRNQGYAGIYIDPNDERLVLQFKFLKDKVEAKLAAIRNRRGES